MSWASSHWLDVNVWYREAKAVFEPDEPRGLEAKKPASSVSRPRLRVNEWVELLPQIEVDECCLSGLWERRDQVLFANAQTAGGPAVLELPVAIDAGYDLELDYTLKSGSHSLDLAIPVAAAKCEVSFHSHEKHIDGIQWIDRLGVCRSLDGQMVLDDRNPTAREGAGFEPGDHRLLVSVRVQGDSAAIDVSRDGKPYLRWKGEQASLSLWPEADQWLPLEAKRPGLAVWGNMVTLNRVRIRLVSEGSAENKESQEKGKP